MKRIIRLTESDLTRIVKRVISEQQSSNAKTSAKKFYDALEGSMLSDNEAAALSAVKSLKSKEDVKAFNDELKKLSGGKGFKEIYSSNMSPADTEFDDIASHMLEITGKDPRSGSWTESMIRALASDFGMRGTGTDTQGGRSFRGY